MVRNRPRLTQKASWTNEMMKAAIKAVKEDGKKLRETARFYNIPVMTLRDRIPTNDSSEAQLGRKPTFTKEQENNLAQQPLDVTFYSSLNAAFARDSNSFMKVNAFTKITPYDIASLFNKAYIRFAKIEKGVSGFDKTGLFPLDTETFSEEDFTVLNTNESALVSVVDEEPQKNIHEIAVPTVGQVQHEALNHGPKPSTSRQVMDVDETNPMKIFILRTLEKEERNKRKENNNLKKASKKILKPKGKSKYRKSDSKLFKPQVTKAKKKLCRRNISFSSSEDEDKCEEIILCDDNEMDDVDLLSFGDSGAISGNELPTEAGCCLLCGEIGRDSELWFMCGFCAGWVHAECSAADSVENFVCDYCKNVS
ncbi:hypothetical protein J6590_073093 [Homalodisca vitripennis]|nr:hypothetical protein J6590_073093 [Homalodisca vitripennis]